MAVIETYLNREYIYINIKNKHVLHLHTLYFTPNLKKGKLPQPINALSDQIQSSLKFCENNVILPFTLFLYLHPHHDSTGESFLSVTIQNPLWCKSCMATLIYLAVILTMSLYLFCRQHKINSNSYHGLFSELPSASTRV